MQGVEAPQEGVAGSARHGYGVRGWCVAEGTRLQWQEKAGRRSRQREEDQRGPGQS